MPYIGNQGSIAGFVNQPSKQDLTGATGGTLTLTHAVSGPEDISLFINNVRQEPTESYTVTGTTVTLQGYTVAATDDIYVLYNGLTQLSSVPVDGSVTSSKLGSNIDIAGTLDVTGALTADSGIKLGSGTDALSDYDEGTFTATVAAESGTINSYSVSAAKYTRIGDIVHVFIRFQVTDKGTGTNFVVSGLPFTSANQLLGIWSETNTTGLTGFMFTAGTGATSFTSRRADNWGNNCLVNGSYSVSITYHI